MREKIWSKSRTFAGDVWFRFRRKPTAIAGFVIIIALMLFALVGPLFTPYDYSVQKLEVVNVPPVMKVSSTNTRVTRPSLADTGAPVAIKSLTVLPVYL